MRAGLALIIFLFLLVSESVLAKNWVGVSPRYAFQSEVDSRRIKIHFYKLQDDYTFKYSSSLELPSRDGGHIADLIVTPDQLVVQQWRRGEDFIFVIDLENIAKPKIAKKIEYIRKKPSLSEVVKLNNNEKSYSTKGHEAFVNQKRFEAVRYFKLGPNKKELYYLPRFDFVVKRYDLKSGKLDEEFLLKKTGVEKPGLKDVVHLTTREASNLNYFPKSEVKKYKKASLRRVVVKSDVIKFKRQAEVEKTIKDNKIKWARYFVDQLNENSVEKDMGNWLGQSREISHMQNLKIENVAWVKQSKEGGSMALLNGTAEADIRFDYGPLSAESNTSRYQINFVSVIQTTDVGSPTRVLRTVFGHRSETGDGRLLKAKFITNLDEDDDLEFVIADVRHARESEIILDQDSNGSFQALSVDSDVWD